MGAFLFDKKAPNWYSSIMNLHEYKDLYGLEVFRQLAERAGSSPGYFNNVVAGRRNMGKKLAIKLEELTKGELKASVLLGLPQPN